MTRRAFPRETVYLNLFDVGVSYAVTRLTGMTPSGVRLPPGGEYVFDRHHLTGDLGGAQLTWPAGLGTGAPRPETVLAVITTEPQDLGHLQQAAVRDPFPVETPGDLLARFTEGRTRDLRWPARFCVPSLSFLLDPKPRA
jgi:hypothetical protein